MRVLIESRKLTIELATTKQPAAEKPVANTFATETAIKDPNVSQFDNESQFYSTSEPYSAAETDTTVYPYTQLPRRKSIHKRIGRFFLRISRMCSDSQCNAYAHQYCGAASELPAEGLPTDGSTSFYEMPGSFPQVELEQPYSEKPLVRYLSNSQTSLSAAPEHLRDYYKSNENATLRRHPSLSVANLPQLPRLEVPQSRYCVPKLMSDHSPLTPSPISPFTPVIDANSAHSQNSSSDMYLDTVSPCENPKQGQLFAHYGSWANPMQLSPATPSTTTSYGSSHATTPLSAHPSSAHSSFQSWPQPQSGPMPPTYTPTHSPLNYNPRMNDPSAVGTISWPGIAYLQPYDYPTLLTEPQVHDSLLSFPVTTAPYDTSPQAQSCYERQSQFFTPQLQPKFPQSSSICDAPPAYDPVAPDSQPPTSNLRQRYPISVCQHCEKVFTGKYGPGNCKRHVQQTHETILDRMRSMCKVCKKTYNRADAMRKHAWKKHRLEEFRPNKRRKDA